MSTPPKMPTRLGTAFRWAFWRGMMAIGGFELKGQFPSGGGYVVVGMRHVSHADPASMIVALGPWRPSLTASAADYWYTKRIRRIAVKILGNGFPIRRQGGGTEDLLATVDLLRSGGIVVIFPEGTRKQTSEKRWHSGASVLAEAAGVPIVPVFIHGTEELMPVGANRPRFVPITVTVGEPVAAGTDLRQLLDHASGDERAAIAEGEK